MFIRIIAITALLVSITALALMLAYMEAQKVEPFQHPTRLEA